MRHERGPEGGGGGPLRAARQGPRGAQRGPKGCSPPLGARHRDRHIDLTLVGNIGFLVALLRFFIFIIIHGGCNTVFSYKRSVDPQRSQDRFFCWILA